MEPSCKQNNTDDVMEYCNICLILLIIQKNNYRIGDYYVM